MTAYPCYCRAYEGNGSVHISVMCLLIFCCNILQLKWRRSRWMKGVFSLRIYSPTHCVFDDDSATSEDQMGRLNIHYYCDLSKQCRSLLYRARSGAAVLLYLWHKWHYAHTWPILRSELLRCFRNPSEANMRERFSQGHQQSWIWYLAAICMVCKPVLSVSKWHVITFHWMCYLAEGNREK